MKPAAKIHYTEADWDATLCGLRITSPWNLAVTSNPREVTCLSCKTAPYLEML